MSATVTVNLPGKAIEALSGTGWAQGQYDEPEQPEVHAAYKAAVRTRRGRGYSYRLELSQAAAEYLRDWCELLGSTWVGGGVDPDTYNEGQALLLAAQRIKEAMA